MIKLSHTSYNRISESNFFNLILSTGLWLLHSLLRVRFLRMVANRSLKMRAPVHVTDGGRFVVVYTCSMRIDPSTFDLSQLGKIRPLESAP